MSRLTEVASVAVAHGERGERRNDERAGQCRVIASTLSKERRGERAPERVTHRSLPGNAGGVVKTLKVTCVDLKVLTVTQHDIEEASRVRQLARRAVQVPFTRVPPPPVEQQPQRPLARRRVELLPNCEDWRDVLGFR